MYNSRIILKKSLILLLLFISIITVSFATNGNTATQSQNKIQVLIGFENTPGMAEKALIRAFGGKIKYSYNIIPSIAAEIPESALEGIRRNPMITSVVPDIKVSTTGSYSDELNNTWGMVRIGEEAAHGNEYFGNTVKVAIIDSGIDYNNSEFKDCYMGGYDFVNDNSDPYDIDGHGTHVAGTIAASRNSVNVVGAAPKVEIYALKALENGTGDISDIIAALDWCVENDIKITNNSYGSSTDPGLLVKQAFNNSYNLGMLHISSAGNASNRAGKGDNVGYPAKYTSVIAVAASDEKDRRASFSSTGPDVELIAPGVNIYSTWINNDYYYLNGTSMASPHVVGVAAQVWSIDPNLSNIDIRSILNSTAEDLNLPAEHQGNGLVRADLAINKATEVIVVPKYNLTLDSTVGGSINPEAGTYTYDEETNVTLTATPNEGYEFDKWIINEDPIGTSTTTVTMNLDVNATAYFKEINSSNEIVLAILSPSDGTTYSGNVWFQIEVSAYENDNPIPNANIELLIKEPDNSSTIKTDITDITGIATFKYRVSKFSIKGTYTIEASSSENTTVSSTFIVE